jgi:phosphatidylglycerol lysyltransferase
MTVLAGAWPGVVRRVMPLVVIAVFGAALWLLAHQLASHRIDDILAYLARLPQAKLAGAIVFTALSYVTLVGYDLSALHYVGRRLPLRDVALASFISYAFSNTIGFAAVTGGSVRYRIYSAAGLNGFEIAAVVVFCTATFGIGAMAISGVVLLIDPRLVGGMVPFEPSLMRALGSALLALLLAYLVFTALQPEQIRIRQWRLKMPSPQLTLVQILVASVDMAFAGGALWLLMPTGLGLDFPRFLAIFVVAVTLGQLSHVPGGLGVFESIIVLLARAPASEVLGALLAYRAIYYLMPLGIAALLLAVTELAERQHRLIRTVRLLGGTLNQVAPSILAAAAFIGGAVLLFAGALPEGAPRLALLRAMVPEWVVELAHLASSIAGVGLLLLSQALLRRLELAYRWSLVLVGAGIVASLLKGFDYSETVVLLVVGIALYPSRALFYRHAPLLGDRLGPAWLTAIAITLAAAAWVGLLSYKNVSYSHAMWWQFAFDANAPRFLRAALAVGVVGLLFLLALLFRPAPPLPGLPAPAELSEAARIVRRSPLAVAGLALLGDKPLLFDSGREGFLSYGVRGHSWVALGDPVGPAGVAAELVWSFRELSHRHDGNPVFFDVGADKLPLYLDLNLTLLKLGEEAWVALPAFDIAAAGRQSLREAHRRAAREGATVEFLTPSEGAASIDELRGVSDAWLAYRKAREKGFSLGIFNPAYLAHFPIAVMRQRGRTLAFANLLTGADGAEVAIDLMRHVAGVPAALIDFFLVEMLAWARDQGYARFNLGLAPLAGLEAKPLGPLWSRAGIFIFNRGGAFPDLRGLRQNKARFLPEWRPKYIAAPGGLALPRVLQDVAALIGGRDGEA